MKAAEFYKHIAQLSDSFESREMEEYLLALYKIIEENKSKNLTYKLLLKMIKDAFIGEPLEFKKEWLKCEESPDGNRMSKKFTNPEISKSINKVNDSNLKSYEFKFESIKKENDSNLNSYDFTVEVLKFQIAELHKMKGKQLENEYRYFGIKSETGNYWYNFDPFGNLECGARCMQDNEKDFNTLDWSFIGELLENGRIYE